MLLRRGPSDDDGTKFLCSKAELIDELESSLPGWLKQDSWREHPPSSVPASADVVAVAVATRLGSSPPTSTAPTRLCTPLRSLHPRDAVRGSGGGCFAFAFQLRSGRQRQGYQRVRRRWAGKL